MAIENTYVESKIISREVNGRQILWIVKTQCFTSQDLMRGNSAIWTVEIKEVGTNYSSECATPWDISLTSGYLDGSVTSQKIGIFPSGNLTQQTTINSNDFSIVFYYSMELEDEVFDMYSHNSKFTVNCPENSIFDGYGTYDTQWLFDDYVGDEVFEEDAFGVPEVDASEVVVSNANIGHEAIVGLLNDSNSSNILHQLSYTYTAPDEGNAVDNRSFTDVKIKGSSWLVDRDLQWTVPIDFYATIPNDRQGEIYLRLKTYALKANGTLEIIDSTYNSFTAYAVEEDCKPELNPTIYDSNANTVALTGDDSKLIRYKSHATYRANAVVKNYASLVSIEVANGSTVFNTEGGTFEGFVNDYFTFQVTDSRGYSTTISITPPIIPYINLTCIADAEAPTADGELNFTIFGNYFNGNFGAADNTLKVYYRIKEISQTTGEGSFSAWRETVFELGTNKYTAAISISNIDYRNTFIIEAYAVDIFGNVYSDEEATSALPIFDWGINDFNMNCDMTVYGTLTVNGNVVATGTVNGQGSGNSSYEIHYGTCQSAGDVGAKLVTCPTFTNLATGSSIRVKFAYANTAANVVMNVNNTGVISVKINDEENDLTGAWKKGAVRDFVYDGINWIIVTYN